MDGTVRVDDEIRLYDGPAPGSEDWTHAELSYRSAVWDTPVVTNVVAPTLTPVVPASGCGTAVVIAPGGAFHALSIDSEGFAAATWLAERGVTAFVLKYRVVPSGEDATAEVGRKTPAQFAADVATVVPLAVSDATAALRVVRARADEFGVDPERVGFLGFSAGGHLALRVAVAEDERARPDFVAPVYAPIHGLELRPEQGACGPMFLAAAADDDLGFAADALEVTARWQRAGLPVELHLYRSGGHGFGMRRQGLPSDRWIERFGDWLSAAGLLGAARSDS